MAQVADEVRSGDIIALGVGHEQRIEFVDELCLDLVEMLREVIFGHDHAVEDVHGIVAQLVMVTEAKIQDAADKGIECDLVALQYSVRGKS